jgi:coiled-coil and C2 domain-containing protein 1
VPDDLDDIGDDLSGGDSDLEAELAAITAGGGARKPRPKPKAKNIVAPEDLDSMVAASLRDIGSDEELSDDDDDPDLLNELSAITGDPASVEYGPDDEEDEGKPVPSTPTANVKDVIKTRIQMYAEAEENAKKSGDSSKARRFNRGLKALKDLLKQAEAGKSVNPDDIPPEVSVKMAAQPKVVSPDAPPLVPKREAPTIPIIDEQPPSDLPPAIPPRRASKSKPPSEPAPVFESTSSSEVKLEPDPERTITDPKLKLLNDRKLAYKTAALEAKKAGDNAKALKFIKTVKQFDNVIQALENGQEVDLNNMPPHPSELDKKPEAVIKIVEPPKKEEAEAQREAEPQTDETPEEENLIQASTVMEALQQRLEKYKSTEKAAKDEGNSSKARRVGRIVKQYEDAIKMHKSGKPIPVDDLPTPPGYGPIPVDGPPKPSPVPSPKPPVKAQEKAPEVPPPVAAARPATKNEKQITVLLQRHKEFKDAAIEAKKRGDIEDAKEYLKTFKGIEKLIETARGGIPIDMSTVPIPPSKRAALEDSFTFVHNEECAEGEESDVDLNTRLEEQLSKQLILCKNTRDHHRAMGDVAGTNKFENLALSVQKDLDFVRLAHRKKLPIPKFHYEMKQFSVVKCNTDLSDNEVEVHVIRGINYSVPNPKDVDTYVKVEFPWPQVRL